MNKILGMYILKALKLMLETEGCYGKSINVGSGFEISIKKAGSMFVSIFKPLDTTSIMQALMKTIEWIIEPDNLKQYRSNRSTI
jgi:hypothetical protein